MYRFLVILLFSVIYTQSQIVAFPGAEGFGAYSKGGRGGQVLFVTNLNDYNPENEEPIEGSLRWACDTYGPRTVIFSVSGIIELKKELIIDKPFITIAGQSAPGDGICIKDYSTRIITNNVIIRHIRFRPGDEPGAIITKQGGVFEPDALEILSGAHDVIIDHCSASWGIDEVLSVWGTDEEGQVTNVTVQWCIISESLNDSYHQKGEHGLASLIVTNGDISFHHNLYAHHKSRTPKPGSSGDGSLLFDFRNNVIYNYIFGGYTDGTPIRMNYIGNYIIQGPISFNNNLFAFYRFFFDGPWNYIFDATKASQNTIIYLEGNHLKGAGDINNNQWNLIYNSQKVSKVETLFPVSVEVKTETAITAYESVLSYAGAILPKRDSIDERVIGEVQEGNGKIIDSQEDVGGWTNYESSLAPIDNDNDGLPDDWETKHGLNPANNHDNILDNDKDGYTNIEEWLNGTIP